MKQFAICTTFQIKGLQEDVRKGVDKTMKSLCYAGLFASKSEKRK